MPLLQTPVRPTNAFPRVQTASCRMRGRLRSAEELLRDMAFVLQAARTVRKAMEETKGASCCAG